MEIQYQLGRSDYAEIARVVPLRRVRIVQFTVVGLALLLFWGMVAIDALDWMIATALSAFMILLPFLSTFLLRLRIVKMLARTPFYQGPIRSEISEEGVKMIYTTGESFMKWEGHSRWRETNNLFVLFMGESFMRPYPKRAFTAEELATFRTWLRTRIPPQSI